MIEFHKNNWIYPKQTGRTLEWHLSKEAQKKILQTKLNKLKINSKLAKANLELGNNPYVALSGGIDSQAACLLLMNAGRQFTAVIAVYENGFNMEDVLSAKNFCDKFKIKYVEIEINVLSFLTSKLNEYSCKYSCPSPQITIHLAFFEMVYNILDASCIICGGNAPYLRSGMWTFGSSKSQIA